MRGRGGVLSVALAVLTFGLAIYPTILLILMRPWLVGEGLTLRFIDALAPLLASLLIDLLILALLLLDTGWAALLPQILSAILKLISFINTYTVYAPYTTFWYETPLSTRLETILAAIAISMFANIAEVGALILDQAGKGRTGTQTTG